MSKYICNKLTTRNTTIITFLSMAVIAGIAFMLHNNWMAVMILMSIGRFGYGIAYACTPALYADTIVYSEWKTGKNATGWISGLQNVPLKVGVMTRGIIINSCLAAGGFVAGVEAADAGLKRAISMAFIGIPAIALLIAGILLLVGFGLTKQRVLEYQNEISARKA